MHIFGSRGLRRAVTALTLSLVISHGDVAVADDTKAKIKAAFIYNFARFTEWPDGSFDGSDGKLRICYRQNNPLADALPTIAGERVGNYAIELVPVAATDIGPPDCHIAVLTSPGALLSQPRIRGLLTVLSLIHI